EIAAGDCRERGGKGEYARGDLIDGVRDGALLDLPLLLVGEIEQMIVDHALIRIAEDLARTNDLSEFYPRVGIVGVEVRVRPFDCPTERYPKLIGIVTWKRTEQIV